jgi:hypothetical protein
VGTRRSHREHRRFLEDSAAMPELKEMVSLSAIDYRGFDGYFFPGGYEQLWDLASDSSS